IAREQAEAGRRQIERLTGGVIDFGYLLLGYAVLRGPIVGLLTPIATPLAAAVVASGVAALVWLFLIARLHWIAGVPGIVLGLVLGAPVLISLPLLDASLLQASWPTTIAGWAVGTGILLLLVVLRGPTQAFSQSALGARLDRGL